MTDLRNKFVPVNSVPSKLFHKSCDFPIDQKVQEAIRKKHSTHRRWMSTKNRDDSESNHLEYQKARNNVTRLLRQAKHRFEQDVAKGIKENPKRFLIPCTTQT